MSDHVTGEEELIRREDALRALRALYDGALYARDEAETPEARRSALERVSTYAQAIRAVRAVEASHG